MLVRLPASEDHPGPVTGLQVGPAASATPAGLFAVHLTCPARRSAEEDLSPAVARLERLAAAEGDPGTELKVLMAVYFSRRTGGGGGRLEGLPESVAVCGGPDVEIGFDAAVKEVSGMPALLVKCCKLDVTDLSFLILLY